MNDNNNKQIGNYNQNILEEEDVDYKENECINIYLTLDNCQFRETKFSGISIYNI